MCEQSRKKLSQKWPAVGIHASIHQPAVSVCSELQSAMQAIPLAGYYIEALLVSATVD